MNFIYFYVPLQINSAVKQIYQITYKIMSDIVTSESEVLHLRKLEEVS